MFSGGIVKDKCRNGGGVGRREQMIEVPHFSQLFLKFPIQSLHSCLSVFFKVPPNEGEHIL